MSNIKDIINVVSETLKSEYSKSLDRIDSYFNKFYNNGNFNEEELIKYLNGKEKIDLTFDEKVELFKRVTSHIYREEWEIFSDKRDVDNIIERKIIPQFYSSTKKADDIIRELAYSNNKSKQLFAALTAGCNYWLDGNSNMYIRLRAIESTSPDDSDLLIPFLRHLDTNNPINIVSVGAALINKNLPNFNSTKEYMKYTGNMEDNYPSNYNKIIKHCHEFKIERCCSFTEYLIFEYELKDVNDFIFFLVAIKFNYILDENWNDLYYESKEYIDEKLSNAILQGFVCLQKLEESFKEIETDNNGEE